MTGKKPFNLALATMAGLCLIGSAAGAQEKPNSGKEPTGWFGVRITDQAILDGRGNAFFDSYPVVTNVDSGSPAARAGVMPGDVLISFNSHDMRGGSVELEKWLKVGAPFNLTIRRNDKTRMLKGKLGRRPRDWDQRMMVQLSVDQIMERQSGTLSKVPAEKIAIKRIGDRMPRPEPLPTLLTPALGYGSGVYPFAGAELIALNDDLSDVLDVKPEGVFVTNVVKGTPASDAGLRGGDIILRANNARVSTPIDLVRVIRVAVDSDRSVVLQIVRKHQPQSLTLRW